MADPERLTITPVTTLEEEPGKTLLGLLRLSFGGTAEGWTDFCNYLAGDQGGTFATEIDGETVGGYSIYDMAQWWGGRSVKLAGFAGVATAPHRRGEGLASQMMRLALRRLRAEGFPTAGLYASNMPLYRKVGFEQAAVKYSYEIPLEKIGIRREECPLERVEPTDPRFRDLYARWVGHGNLDRNEAIWKRVARQRDPQQLHAYLAGPADAPEGYVVIAQDPPGEPWGYRVTLRDFVALTGRAARRIWALLGSMTTLGTRVRWNGPAVDPRLGHLPECFGARINDCERSFLRILDVKAAFEARGYPTGVEGAVELEVVEDDVIPETVGRYVLEVADGRGVVREGGSGALKTGIRRLATLYSGFLGPRHLRQNGWIDADDATVETATRLFASEPPWMPDHY